MGDAIYAILPEQAGCQSHLPGNKRFPLPEPTSGESIAADGRPLDQTIRHGSCGRLPVALTLLSRVR